MNKSKFLKKSLAMLLALMLVFAMIPLSASAAEGPAVTGVIVNGVAAEESGDASFTATITEPAVGDKVVAKVQVENDAGTVAHYTNATLLDGNNASEVGELWQFELTDKEMEKKSFTFDVLVGTEKKQTYTVTYTTEAADGDATVKSVYLDGEYDDWNNIDTNNEIHYTVVAPYGLDFNKGPHYVEVTPNSAKASVVKQDNTKFQTDGDAYLVPVSAYDERVPFTVVAENGKPANYTVTVVKPIPFASFSMEGERHESQISRVTEEPDFQVTGVNEEATVELYPSYKYDGKFTPTFETNYGVKVVVTDTDVELKSGETYDWEEDLDVTDTSADFAIDVTVVYSDGNKEPWELAFDVRTDDGNTTEKDTIPAIKGVTVNNYVAEIEGTTITLTLPKSVRENATDLKVKISNGTEVNVVDSSSKVYTVTSKDSNDGYVAVKNINKGFFETDKYTLRVTAAIKEFDADEPAVQDYTLNIATAQVEQPKLNSMTLQNADGTVTLKANIDQSKGIVSFDNSNGKNAIPYRYKSVEDLANDDWKLFWSVSQGATFTYNNSKTTPGTIMPLSGETVVNGATYLPDDTNRFVGACEAEDYVIVAVEGESAKAYKVVFTSAPASQESKLSDMELTWNNVTEMSQLNNKNHVEANVNNVNGKITATINYKDWESYNNVSETDSQKPGNNGYEDGGFDRGGASVVTTLPEGAEMYFVGMEADGTVPTDAKLYPIEVLNETTKKTTTSLPSVGWYGSYKYGDEYDVDDKVYALKLIVVSEALADKVSEKEQWSQTSNINLYRDLNTEAYKPFYTEYNLTLTQAAPRTGTDIDTLTVYDNYTGAKVTAAPVGNTITLNIPYYFVDENRKSHENLFLDYTPEQGGQTASASSQKGVGLKTTELNNLVWKDDGTLDETQSVKLVWDNSDNHKAFMAYEPGKTGNNYGWIGHKDADGKDLYPIQVKAEDGKTRTTPYSVVINILDANGEAELNSVTIAGSTATPNGKNVTVNVPFDTEVTSLAPEFNVSENAYVIEGGSDGIGNATANLEKMVDEGETFNFLTSRTFTVVSEDGQNWNTYTITVVPSESFPDVTTDKWYYDEVMTAANKGWVTGDNGYFKPDDTMKRGDFALIVARILNYDPDLYTTAFPDVDADMYYSKAVAFCKYEGIIDGDDNGNFNAEDPITREEMAKIMCQALKLKVTVPEKTYADDAEIAEWAKGYVYACQEAGIMEGSGDNFNPRDNATRAEGAAVLVRAFA